ncbi:D-aminoacyl-tRNA deacylase [Lapidilactobacillus mulanensis]|uniref:D-aminoacyl-tRNA deacylase n=1 Tax=Lapidilactobacillus mulanensis TaxID=2485999 RepID=A0ABW4DPW2_9LACO|nr:D-aminoacyl-tRNA deacylase [Lapidilactobacillus mulanensis]
MRVTLQRVKYAKVEVAGQALGRIDMGLLLFVGISPTDNPTVLQKMAHKIVNLRIFEDEQGKMNLNVQQVGGGILSISQFTLYADTHKGNRPSFQDAAKPEQANVLYQQFNQELEQMRNQPVATGEFGADMQITALNDGPVTINLEIN